MPQDKEESITPNEELSAYLDRYFPKSDNRRGDALVIVSFANILLHEAQKSIEALLSNKTGKAKIGEGTQSAKNAKRININKMYLIKLYLNKHITNPSTVRDIQKVLVEKEIPRLTRDGKHKKWNYHEIQADLSMLVGCGLMKITEPIETEIFSNEEKEFRVDKTPHYWIKDREFAEKVVKLGGLLRKKDE